MKMSKPLKSWILVALCSIAIFLTVPVARTIQRFVSEKWGRPMFGYAVLSAVGLGFFILLTALIVKLRIRSPFNYIWLVLVTGLYVYFTLKLWKYPEEAVHFIEYGLLGFFIFKALSHHVRDKSIYFSAIIVGTIIGTFDEIFQWIQPGRFWDFRDVGLNSLSVGLFQLAIWKAVAPKFIRRKIRPKSFGIFSALTSVCMVLLGLCASNTPDRLGFYTNRIPFLMPLQKEEPMSEFGYEYKDEDIGLFYSRFPQNKLIQIDKEKGKEYGNLLSTKSGMDYGLFLREYSPFTNPFLHEVRVHIFRRDSHYQRAKNANSINGKRNNFFVAYKENLILEKYFPQTLENSIYRWDSAKVSETQGLFENKQYYESPVSAGLFTRFSEKNVWLTILTVLVVLSLLNLFINLHSLGYARNKI